VFDFYNDEWDDLEEDESSGLLGGWGSDEMDRLLAGSGDQPRRQRQMTYGSRGVRRKSMGAAGKGKEVDPTIVPGSAMFGFLERLPWKIGGRGVKYRPSAADLQEHPGRKTREEGETQALLEESEGEEAVRRKRGKQRRRGGTMNSQSTNTSLSSRGDLFPSEDEDDAVPISDEFAMVLERRTTGGTSDEASVGNSSARRAPQSPVVSSRTASSKDMKSISSLGAMNAIIATDEDLSSSEDLRREEENVRREEEAEIERKRREAQQIAMERGLPGSDSHESLPGSATEPSITLSPISPLPRLQTEQTPSPVILAAPFEAPPPANLEPRYEPPSFSPTSKSISSFESSDTRDG
jgi:hypothetical protein